MDKKQLEEVFAAAKTVSVADVLSLRMKLRKHGSLYEGLCPFHNDKRTGGFKVDVRKGRWTCYACGEWGDGVEFISKFDGVSHKEAALTIASAFNLLTPAQIDDLRGGKSRDVVIKPAVYHEVKQAVENTPRSPEHCTKVYTAFAAAAGAPSKKHAEHLKSVRHIQGWESDFFEWPDCKNPAFWKQFVVELRNQGITEPLVDAIRYVPGFAFDVTRQRPVFLRQYGIGIRLHNADGSISGLQVRADNPKPGSTRYKLLSSSWAAYNDNDEGIDGAIMSQAIDVVWPENHEPFCAAVTEGRFKAIQLAKRGYVVLSLNGVNNQGLVVPKFLELVKSLGFDSVHIYFDAEMDEKIGVARSGLLLADTIASAGLTPSFIIWDPALGKGIDDMLFAGHHDKLKIRRAETMRKHLVSIFGEKLESGLGESDNRPNKRIS